MWLTDLNTTEEREAQYNPSEIEETLSVNYARLAIMGLSHKPMQYQNTDNLSLDFTLVFRAFDDTGNRVNDMKEMKKFLYSLCYSPRSAGSIIGGAPPRVLFIFPNLASLTCKITQLKYKTLLQALDGSPTMSEAKITIEEIRDTRLFSEDVREYGIQRASAGEGGKDI
jgi:hypothetical protein